MPNVSGIRLHEREAERTHKKSCNRTEGSKLNSQSGRFESSVVLLPSLYLPTDTYGLWLILWKGSAERQKICRAWYSKKMKYLCYFLPWPTLGLHQRGKWTMHLTLCSFWFPCGWRTLFFHLEIVSYWLNILLTCWMYRWKLYWFHKHFANKSVQQDCSFQVLTSWFQFGLNYTRHINHL